MNLPPSATKGIVDMVRSILPYESGYEPKTKHSLITHKIFLMIVEHDNSFAEWEGFTLYTLKKIDDSTAMQKHVDRIIASVLPVLDGYVNEK